MQECEDFRQRVNIYQALTKNGIFESVLCSFEKLNFQADRKRNVSLLQD